MNNALHRRGFCISILILAFCLCLNRAAPAAEAAPWLQAETADKYVFVGKAVWEIESGKIVSPQGAPEVYGTARRIVGVNDKLFDIPVSGVHPAGMTTPSLIEMLDGSSQQMPTLDGKAENDTGNGPAFWVNSDHRRVVWMQGGDYWRGEIDWATAKVVNRKQLTQLGVFNPMTKPLLWWGHLLFVHGNFDKAKPIVRINLASGEITELETYRAFVVQADGRLMVSPNACRVICVTPSVIYCYDVRTGRASMTRTKFEDLPSTRGRQLFVGLPPIWTDEDTIYSLDGAGYLARIDLRNSRMDVLQEPPVIIQLEERAYTKVEGLVPGSHLIDIARMSSGGKSTHAIPRERFLFDVTNTQRTALPFDDSANGRWLDDSMFLYTKTQGGLSAVGTWLYDRTANSHKRLTGVSIDYDRMAVLKKQKQIWAVSQQAGTSLIRMNLDGSGSQNLGPCQLGMVRQMPGEDRAIDLGFASAKEDLWKPAAVDEAAIAATQPAEPPLGKLKLFELTKDASVDEKSFAELSYDYAGSNDYLTNYCDSVKFAMKLLDAHKADSQTPFSNLMINVDLSDVVDRDHLIRYGHEQALRTIGMDTKLTPDQKRQIADRAGPLLADAYFKQAKPNIKDMSLLFQSSLAAARDSVTGHAGTTPPPATPAQPAQANSQPKDNPPAQPPDNANKQPPQKEKPSRADQAAAERAKRAKEAADRIRGVIGR
jgi:hypothetical protein